jgi:hypothetical protein
MLRPLALALLLTAVPGSMSCAPDHPPVIVGTWEMDLSEILARSRAKLARQAKPDISEAEIEELEKAAAAEVRAQGAIPTQTFRADGTGQHTGMVFDHKIADEFHWQAVESTPTTIAIELWNDNRPEKERTTFTVESPDVLRYADGKMVGIKLVRVK